MSVLRFTDNWQVSICCFEDQIYVRINKMDLNIDNFTTIGKKFIGTKKYCFYLYKIFCNKIKYYNNIFDIKDIILTENKRISDLSIYNIQMLPKNYYVLLEHSNIISKLLKNKLDIEININYLIQTGNRSDREDNISNIFKTYIKLWCQIKKEISNIAVDCLSNDIYILLKNIVKFVERKENIIIKNSNNLLSERLQQIGIYKKNSENWFI